MIFEEHEMAARDEFLAHVRNCKHQGIDDDIDLELRLSETDFWDLAGSIKFIQGNILKIKWEMRCPHSGCVWHLYYCKLAKDIKFQEIQDVLN